MSILSKLTGMPSVTEIIGGVMGLALVGSAIGWTITAHTLKGARQTIALDKAQLAAEANAHQVTIQSLGQCNDQLASKSAESDARAKALTDSTATYEQRLAELKKQGAATADKLAYWSGMASKYQSAARCPIDASLAKELNR